VVAALNCLPAYWSTRQRIKRLVDFFNGARNLKCLESKQNMKKGNAVKKFLRGEKLRRKDKRFINKIKHHWKNIREKLPAGEYEQFKAAMDHTLDR